MKYVCQKRKLNKSKINFIWVFFSNGDFFSLDKKELVALDVDFYDRLIYSPDGILPVASGGFIDFKIRKQETEIYNLRVLHDEKEYRKSRKTYIENRLTLGDQITKLAFFDNNNWSFSILGNFLGKKTGDVIRLEILPNPVSGEKESLNHYICLPDLNRKDIFKIMLDFENCDHFDIFQSEIVSLNLVINENLQVDSNCFCREIVGGSMKIKLQKGFDARKIFLYSYSPESPEESLYDRLCSGKKWSEIDLCNLYVDFANPFRTLLKTECLPIKEIREKSKPYFFVSGWARILKGKTVEIRFCKNRPND